MVNSFVWACPEKGPKQGGIDVSSRGNESYRKFSPFSHNQAYAIPAPGRESLRADSVEGIWQGLKMIHGSTDASLFSGKPRKRHGKPEGHLFGDKLLGYREAREQIYVPVYVYHVVNNALDATKKDLEARLASGPVVLYDVQPNSNIADLSRPYSHAALLADLLNVLKDAPLPPFNKTSFADLQDQVDATLAYRVRLGDAQRRLFDEVITFAYLFSCDELQLKPTFSLRAMKQGGIDDRGRLARYTPTLKTKEPYSALLR